MSKGSTPKNAPSKTGNPSGKGRGNNAPRISKTPPPTKKN